MLEVYLKYSKKYLLHLKKVLKQDTSPFQMMFGAYFIF